MVRGLPGGLGRTAVTLLLIVSVVCSFMLGNALYKQLRNQLADDETSREPEIV